MFSKVITLLFFVTCAIAQLQPGTYQIFNIQLQDAPVLGVGNQFTITNVTIPEFDPRLPPLVGNFWQVSPGPEGDGYSIGSSDLSGPSLVTYAGVMGQNVVTLPQPTIFEIESAGSGSFVVKVPSQDSFWTVGPYVEATKAFDVIADVAAGTDAQRWLFVTV